MSKNQCIAITGASGHLGNCLLQLFLHKGENVKALFTYTKPNFKHPSLTWIEGDINDSKAIEELVNGCSIVIHSAGLISIGDKNSNEVYRVNVQGTESVLKACLKINNSKLIYISSSNAVKESKNNEIFNENRPYKTQSDFTYSFTKATAEQLVLNAVQNLNLDAFIIRPTSILGPPDLKPSLFGQTILDFKNNQIPAVTTGGYNIVDVRDLAQTIWNSLKLGEKGEIYLVGGEYLSVKKIAETANPNKTHIVISLNILLFFMPAINLYQKMFKLKWPITKESIITLKLAPKNMDISKAKNKLNHSIRPAVESIKDLINWHENNNVI